MGLGFRMTNYARVRLPQHGWVHPEQTGRLADQIMNYLFHTIGQEKWMWKYTWPKDWPINRSERIQLRNDQT